MIRKKMFCLTICLLITLAFSACGNNSSTDGDTEKEAASVVETEAQEMDKIQSDTKGIDVDLTTLSSTMVYSEVYNMMSEPDDYLGKTIKMDGSFAVFHNEETDKYYYACIIQDATACCSQGLEFELNGDYKYPDDYPAEGENVCVVGTFDVYEEGGNSYCVLRKATMEDL